MSTLTLIAILFGVPFVLWAFWFVVEFIRYTLSGEYEMDKRLHNICK